MHILWSAFMTISMEWKTDGFVNDLEMNDKQSKK